MADIEIEMPDLAPFHREWLGCTHPIMAIEGATGIGKTFCYEAHHFKLGHRPVNAGDEFWWIDPTLAQARSIFDGIVRKLDAAGVRDLYKISQQPMSITTPTNGVLRFLTADNPDYFYGIKNVRNIIVNEFTRCRPSIMPALITVANKTGARIQLIGNYQGETSAWHLWIREMDGDASFKYFKTTAPQAIAEGKKIPELATWAIDLETGMERSRRMMSAGMFAALYMCEGTTDPTLLVEYGAVSDLWTNEHVPEGKPSLICDVAFQGSDRFVMGRWSGNRLKEIEVFTKRTPDEVENIVKGKAIAYNVPRSSIVFDGDGMGHYLKSYLQGATSYQGGAVAHPQQGQKMSYVNLRAQTHFLTADAINAREYYIETQAFRSELEQEIFACLRTNGQDASGRWGIYPKDHAVDGAKARLGRSPDIFDMFHMHKFLSLAEAPLFVDGLKTVAEHRKKVSFKRTANGEGNTNFGTR